MSSIEPKLVILITPGDASSQVTTAINTARNHVFLLVPNLLIGNPIG